MPRRLAALVGAVALSGTLTLAVQTVRPGDDCRPDLCSSGTITADAGTDGTRVTVLPGQNW